MIATQITIHDIRDAEGYVAACMQRSRILFQPGEREELLAEGLVILYELADRYEPHRAGYRQPGRFSGYAAAYLPRRLEDAWHRLNPQHQARRNGDGRRVWDYGSTPMSLQHDDMPQIAATAATIRVAEDSVVDRALDTMPHWDRMIARPLVALLDDGYRTDEIAARLGLARGEVTARQGAVASAIAAIQHRDARGAA